MAGKARHVWHGSERLLVGGWGCERGRHWDPDKAFVAILACDHHGQEVTGDLLHDWCFLVHGQSMDIDGSPNSKYTGRPLGAWSAKSSKSLSVQTLAVETQTSVHCVRNRDGEESEFDSDSP